MSDELPKQLKLDPREGEEKGRGKKKEKKEEKANKWILVLILVATIIASLIFYMSGGWSKATPTQTAPRIPGSGLFGSKIYQF